MRVVGLICRFLLGLIFLVFGLNIFLGFIPMTPPAGAPGEFLGALVKTTYMMTIVGTTEVLGGVLLLVGLVPLGVIILAPLIVNIIAFHVVLEPTGLPMALIVAAMEAILAFLNRSAFAPLFARAG